MLKQLLFVEKLTSILIDGVFQDFSVIFFTFQKLISSKGVVEISWGFEMADVPRLQTSNAPSSIFLRI
jgi:hypothetical protein